MGLADMIVEKAILASCLEVSASPKPGNVHRFRGFPNTRYEHFLAGAVAMAGAIREAAKRGSMWASGRIDPGDLRLGSLILRAVKSVRSSHMGGNTHLGIAMLFVPLSCSLAYAIRRGMDPDSIGSLAIQAIDASSVSDALNLVRAIRISGMSWLGRLGDEGVDIARGARGIKGMGLNLRSLLSLSPWDNVATEIVEGYRITREIGCPYLIEEFRRTCDINRASVHTYLKILSEIQDSFIARKQGLRLTERLEDALKIGMEKAREVSRRAREILSAGGMDSEEGMALIERLDEDLRREGLNPGSAADLTASSIFLALIKGLRF